MTESVKTTVVLTKDLHRAARIRAIEEGKNLSQVVRELLAAWLEEDLPPPKKT